MEQQKSPRTFIQRPGAPFLEYPAFRQKVPTAQFGSNSWCFLDMQNLYKGASSAGWKINWPQLNSYLVETFGVTRAIGFLGYINHYRSLYRYLIKSGFELQFRPVRKLPNGQIDGGNVDADLASFVMDNKQDYHKAVIIADDADYYRMIHSLNRQVKLAAVISPHHIRNTSSLIRTTLRANQLFSIQSVRNIIQLTC